MEFLSLLLLCCVGVAGSWTYPRILPTLVHQSLPQVQNAIAPCSIAITATCDKDYEKTVMDVLF